MCTKTPTNPRFSLLDEAGPKPRSLNLTPIATSSSTIVPNPSEKAQIASLVERPHISKFDKAIRVYISHFSEKSLRKALKEATSQESTQPSPAALQTLLAQGISISLVKEMQKLPLGYRPTYLETSASIHSDLGNSIHNSSSVARRSMDLYGLRVLKGLVVVHELLRGSKKGESIDEGVKEELVWWFDVLGHDLEVDGGERGSGPLLKSYITYFKTLLASLPTSTSSDSPTLSTVLSSHLTHSLSNHTFRESLLSSIKSSPLSTCGPKTAALNLVIRDAQSFPAVHASLLLLMTKEAVCETIVAERECVFEKRREEFVGFVGRCRELGLGLELGLDVDENEGGVILLETGIGELKV